MVSETFKGNVYALQSVVKYHVIAFKYILHININSRTLNINSKTRAQKIISPTCFCFTYMEKSY